MSDRDLPQPAWSDQPSPRHGTYIPVLRARPGIPVSAHILSARVQVVWVHWMGEDGTKPHYDAPHLCPGCIVGRAKRQYGYLAGWYATVGRYCLIEIPTRPLLDMWPDLDGSYSTLRGQVISIRRMGDRANAQVAVRLVVGKVPADALPPAFDVRAALLRLWQELPGQSNPQGRRTNREENGYVGGGSEGASGSE